MRHAGAAVLLAIILAAFFIAFKAGGVYEVNQQLERRIETERDIQDAENRCLDKPTPADIVRCARGE